MTKQLQDAGGGFTYDQKTGTVIPQALIDASLAANPNASKGGYEGSTPMQDTPGGGAPNLGGFDWQDYLSMFGLPADVVGEVNKIFASNTDPTTAANLALAYIRGTPWYATTYPGIQQGIAKGVISNEADYRNYLNQANQLYQTFYGRQISASELGSLLQNGVDIGTLGKQLTASGNLASLQKLQASNYFTPDELQQIANQNAGLTTSSGDYLNGLLGYTQSLAPIYSQYGVPLTRDVIESNFKNGVTSTQVGQHLQGQAYVAANTPELQYVSGAFGDGALTQDQLSAYGDQQAGLDSGLGEKLNTMVSKAQARLNDIFKGTLATPTLSLNSSGTLGGAAKTPDVGA